MTSLRSLVMALSSLGAPRRLAAASSATLSRTSISPASAFAARSARSKSASLASSAARFAARAPGESTSDRANGPTFDDPSAESVCPLNIETGAAHTSLCASI